MQMKYLSLALAAALATTLTACGGSDNKGNYNKDTLTPVTKPDVKPGEGGNVKPDDENKKPDDGKKPGDDKPEDENKKPDDGKKPGAGEKVEDPTNNIGNAANPGNPRTDNIVVAQNYLRGEGTKFDRTKNPDPKNDGNPTVLGFNDLENTFMSNIVLAHVKKANPTSADDTLTVIAGSTPDEAGKLSLRDTFDFQSYNKSKLRTEFYDKQQLEKELEGEAAYELAYFHGGLASYIQDPLDGSESIEGPLYSTLQYKNDTWMSDGAYVDVRAQNIPFLVATAEKELASASPGGYKIQSGGQEFIIGSIDKSSGSKFIKKDSKNQPLVMPGTSNNKLVGTDDPNEAYIANVRVTPFVDVASYLPKGTVDLSDDLEADKSFRNAYEGGLVVVKANGRANQRTPVADNLNSNFYIRGQEDQIITERNGKVVILHATGSKWKNSNTADDVRMFGALSNMYDIPTIRSDGTVDGFEANPAYSQAFTKGEWVTLPDGELEYVPAFDSSGNYAALKYPGTNKVVTVASKTAEIDPKTGRPNDFNKNSYVLTKNIVDSRIAGNNPTGKELTGKITDNQYNGQILSPTKIRLNHVQYGRVTALADDATLSKLKADADLSKDFSVFNTVNKHRYDEFSGKAAQDKKNVTIDYYFARGLQPTKGEQMPKQGKVNYVGHALMYGLDNSFHGVKNRSNSNAPIGKLRHSVGNFVSAELDVASKQVNGSIYNVWTADSSKVQLGAVEDELVSFKGSVNDTTNSVIGTATRTYVKDDAAAAFKGGFFGPGAQEFAGNINSIAGDQYGDAKWGGVFGAKKITTTDIDIDNGVEVKNP